MKLELSLTLELPDDTLDAVVFAMMHRLITPYDNPARPKGARQRFSDVEILVNRKWLYTLNYDEHLDAVGARLREQRERDSEREWLSTSEFFG